jgi:hypothetical protein
VSAVLAVAEALTDEQRARVEGAAGAGWRGAPAADVIDGARDADWGLAWTEPAWESGALPGVADRVSRQLGLPEREARDVVACAAVALALLTRAELLTPEVEDLAVRAAMNLRQGGSRG